MADDARGTLAGRVLEGEDRVDVCVESDDGSPFDERPAQDPLPSNVRQLESLLNEAIEYSESREGNVLRLPKGGFKDNGATAPAVQPAGRGARA